MIINQITSAIIDHSINIHRELGPELFESVYEEILCHALTRHGLQVERQKEIPIVFQGIKINSAFRADLIIESNVLVELKSVEFLSHVHKKQVVTYLRLTGLQIGLLINFNESKLVDGIQRIANRYVDGN